MRWQLLLVVVLLVACSQEPVAPVKEPVKEQLVILKEDNATTAATEPESKSGLVADGIFVNRASRVKGKVTIDRLADRSYKLLLSSFDAQNINDVMLALTESRYVVSSRDIESYYVVGELKGSISTQYYFFPRDVNISKYRSVTLISKENLIVEGSAVLEFAE